MASYQGSLTNFSSYKKLLIVTLVFLAPLFAILGTIFLLLTVSWWEFILIIDLIIGIIAISLSGSILKDHTVILSEDEVIFKKGWSRGRIPYRNIVKVYRVLSKGKDAVLIIFNDPSSRSNPNRCLSIEQIFHRKDKEKIFHNLKKDHKVYNFSVIDRANHEMIISDRRSLCWVPI